MLRYGVNMGRPRTHDQHTAAALVDAAERVAEADGPAALSLRRVADEAGTTTRAVYSLFGSKEGLLVALAVRGFQLLARDLDTLPETRDPLEDLVRAGSVVFRRFAVRHPVLFRISFHREAVPRELVGGFAEAQQAAFAKLIARFDRLATGGGLPGCPPRQAAMCFHAQCEGLAGLELRGALPARAESQWAVALRALLLGLGRGSED
jgi:AcrR family transcriptional regulator